MSVEEWLVNQIFRHVMALDRIQKLIEAGHTDQYKIKKMIEDLTAKRRSGGDMRAVTVQADVTRQIKEHYKSCTIEKATDNA